MNDLERSSTYIEFGVTGALALGSQKRYNEAKDIYSQMLDKWPHEQRVKTLNDLFRQQQLF
jgi:hypothetical protein